MLPIAGGKAGSRLLTEALGDLPAPGAVALAGEHGGQGQLVALQAGVADAGAPAEIRAHHLPVGNGLRSSAGDGCGRRRSRVRDLHFFIVPVNKQIPCGIRPFLLSQSISQDWPSTDL